MEKIVEQGILYDFYGPLLTAHQQEIYEAVVYNNLSLGEIAKENGISRQGVHDIIKRCDKILAEYEEKLQLVKRFSSSRKKLERIKALSEEIKENGMELQAREITSLTAEIIEEL
ncbi:MAG: DNA-binding protein [Lachnospiraceae bacterium]|nr:DNA-binding protein [Lachnospiraceae bacterium]